MKHKHTFFLLILLILVVSFMNGNIKNSGNAISSVSSAQAQEETGVDANTLAGEEQGVTAEEGRAILALLNDLKSLTLDDSIFSDPIFMSLIDFSAELTPEPKGRQDPFAPINTPATPTDQKTGKITP